MDAGGGGRTRERALWRAAHRYRDLCELGALFAQGEIARFPGWGRRGLDAESRPIAPALAALNRAGFLTLASQPGALEVEGRLPRRQRAFVFGFADDRASRALEPLARDASLAVSLAERGAPAPEPVAVVDLGGEPCAFAGGAPFEIELELFARECGRDAVDDLARMRFASAVDLVWGRERHLWQALSAAFGIPDPFARTS